MRQGHSTRCLQACSASPTILLREERVARPTGRPDASESTSGDRGPATPTPLPYFTVADLATTLASVRELGGSVIHPGDRWAVCRDYEGSPFALAAALAPGE
jgi:hypothetical protein